MQPAEVVGCMAQFNVGQRVVVRQNEPSPFAGLPAIVEDVRPNDRGVAILDRYVVVFSWGEKQTFYEPQLQTLGINLNNKEMSS
jgi:hypothetical protein